MVTPESPVHDGLLDFPEENTVWRCICNVRWRLGQCLAMARQLTQHYEVISI